MSDRLRSALESIVRSLTRRVDFLGMFPARVLIDHGDQTLDLELDDVRLPKLVKVPLRTHLPGVRVKVKSGARVLVAFEGNGDPSRPAAYLWESGALETLTVEATGDVTIKAANVTVEGATESMIKGGTVNLAPAVILKLAGGSAPIARVGDNVVVQVVAPGAPASGLIIGPGNPKALG